jgi:hypothetical protein
LKIPTDERHIAQRRKYVLKKPQRQSSLAKTVGGVDADHSNQRTSHVPSTVKQVEERRESHYSDERSKTESDDSDGEGPGVGSYGGGDENKEISAIYNVAAPAAAADVIDMLNFDAPEYFANSSSSQQHAMLSSVSADMNGANTFARISPKPFLVLNNPL